MKPNETRRYKCGECQTVFDLRLDPACEAEIVDEPEPDLDLEPTCCPFCGDANLMVLPGSCAEVRPSPA
jgi:hypothetical protein